MAFDLSKYVQLYDGVLLEYIYTNHSSPETFNTLDLPIELMRDSYTGGTYLFNPPAYQSQTGNVRGNSSAAINSTKTRFASLITNRSISYNDVDSNLTPSANLLQTFSPNIDVEYDTIRLHFASGLDFRGFDGFVIALTVQRRDGLDLNLANINFLKSDTATFNPNPFLLGERVYASYLEFKIPSAYYMLENFYSNPSSTNTLGYKFTEAKGFIKTTTIDATINGISSTYTKDGFPAYETQVLSRSTISTTDEFNLLAATIEESTLGDFFEMYGEYNGVIYEDFMASLNSQPNSSWIVFHSVVTQEQIGTSFVETAEQTFTQLDNFDVPIRFRPIILNSAVAVSFALDYTMRIYNRANGTQIIRKSRIISTDVGTYGRRLRRINLGTVPTVVKVYNELPRDNGENIIINDVINVQRSITQGTSPVANTPVQTQIVPVTVFRDKGAVTAKISPVKVEVRNGN
jgi:hypothetical protein